MVQAEDGYLSRFKEFRLVENKRESLIEEVIAKLDAVSSQLEDVTKERAREIAVLQADLESEKEARRGWQDRAGTFREQLLGMEQARFVLVLIDADADMYLFHERFLSRGLQGGQDAADEFMVKAREHLLSLEPSIDDAKTIPVMVKAYANLSGLAQACVRDKKLSSVSDMVQFWIGFSRRYPLVDFVDVGSGKEEADNKIREVLGFHVSNPQCRHILLGCCNDAGYVPVLRQYAAQSSISERITLLSAGPIQPAMGTLGFRATSIFEPLFGSSILSAVLSTLAYGRSLSQSPTTLKKSVKKSLSSVTASSPVIEKPVYNSERLGPILRDKKGKRIDRSLVVEESLAFAMKKRNLCSWHYLRSDCTVDSCPRKHSYPRPLSWAEFDALWFVARQGMCYRLRKGGDCNEDRCMYGHGSS